jgi:hypothetical protein
MTLKQAIKIIMESYHVAFDHEEHLGIDDTRTLNAKLQDTNEYVREFILVNVDSLDEILDLNNLVLYFEMKYDECEEKYAEDWGHLTFHTKEKLFSNFITQQDILYCRRKKWIREK